MNRDDAIRAIMTSLDAGAMRDYDITTTRDSYAHIYDSLRAKAEAVLSALEAMGIALVPVSPTITMLKAGVESINSSSRMGGVRDAGISQDVWDAMLFASPFRQGDRPVSPNDGGSLETNKEGRLKP